VEDSPARGGAVVAGRQPVVAVWRRAAPACLRCTTTKVLRAKSIRPSRLAAPMPASAQSIPSAEAEAVGEGEGWRSLMTTTSGALKVPRPAAASRVSGERRSRGTWAARAASRASGVSCCATAGGAANAASARPSAAGRVNRWWRMVAPPGGDRRVRSGLRTLRRAGKRAWCRAVDAGQTRPIRRWLFAPTDGWYGRIGSALTEKWSSGFLARWR
jgi:hypothetical protein